MVSNIRREMGGVEKTVTGIIELPDRLSKGGRYR